MEIGPQLIDLSPKVEKNADFSQDSIDALKRVESFSGSFVITGFSRIPISPTISSTMGFNAISLSSEDKKTGNGDFSIEKKWGSPTAAFVLSPKEIRRLFRFVSIIQIYRI